MEQREFIITRGKGYTFSQISMTIRSGNNEVITQRLIRCRRCYTQGSCTSASRV